MASGRTSWLKEQHLNLLRATNITAPATMYVALTTTNPTATTAGTEVSTVGTNYARQSVSFGAPASGQVSNSATVTFPTIGATPYGTVEGIEIWDAPTGGNRWYWSDAPALSNASGNQIQIAAGALVVNASS